MAHNSFVAVIHNSFRQALAEIHPHRWIKRRRVLKCLQADEELEVWVFLDLLDQFFVREPEASLDDQRTQCHANGLCWRSKSFTGLSCVIILQHIPRNELSQLGPAIITREFAAKRQEEVFERELMTMLTSVHVENSGPL